MLASRIVDLTGWKLTLPTGTVGDPGQVEQPDLDSYADGSFGPAPDGKSVSMIAPTQGVVVPGSKYPRCELREMAGADLASWDATTGFHALTLAGRCSVLPFVKPEVVLAQVHAESYVAMIWLSALAGSPTISVRLYDDFVAVLDPAYVLGQPYVIQLRVRDGELSVAYNGTEQGPWPLKDTAGLYFKAGAYVQSNEPGKGHARVSLIGLSVFHG